MAYFATNEFSVIYEHLQAIVWANGQNFNFKWTEDETLAPTKDYVERPTID